MARPRANQGCHKLRGGVAVGAALSGKKHSSAAGTKSLQSGNVVVRADFRHATWVA